MLSLVRLSSVWFTLVAVLVQTSTPFVSGWRARLADFRVRGFLSEVTCHHVAALRDAFSGLTVGLVKPTKASKALREFVLRVLDLDPHHDVYTSLTSKHSKYGSTARNDVIAFECDGALHVGQVWAHCEVQGVCFALIQQLELVSSDDKAGTAIWRVTDAYDLIGREMIRDALIWNDYEDGVIRTILPRDLF